MSFSLLKYCKKMGLFTRFQCKHMFSTDREVRVRFAPSPTGMLHLGGLRTALLNFLFARRHGGKFVLRIEDTDQQLKDILPSPPSLKAVMLDFEAAVWSTIRSIFEGVQLQGCAFHWTQCVWKKVQDRRVPGAIKNLEDILQWAGIIQDEGPSAGGPYGPYLQSERKELYREQVNTLLKNGHCYKCFCTEKRLRLMRREAMKLGESPGYDNKCRHLTEEESNNLLSKKVPYTIRFKYKPIKEAWKDAVFGMMLEKQTGQTLEGDFVVMKSDGFPTYHFANIVDDHFMKISHVFRGEEWSISTPKHLQMYAAFGWKAPQFAHLPLILGKGGVKLSKRHGDMSVEGFRDKGYEPAAILNYLTTISGGFTLDTMGKTLDEMVDMFDPKKITRHSAQLQPDKLETINRVHLQRRLKSKEKCNLLNEARTLLLQHYKNRLTKDSSILSDDFLENFLTTFMNLYKGNCITYTDDFPIIMLHDQQNQVDNRINRLSDITDSSLEYIWIAPSSYSMEEILSNCSDCGTLITAVIDKLQNIEQFEVGNVKPVLMDACNENGLKTKNVMFVLRKILSDLKEGPSVTEMMTVLTKEETIFRLQKFKDSL